MRFWEAIVAIIFVVLLLGARQTRAAETRRLCVIPSICLLLAMVGQVMVEGLRWQFLPVCLAAILFPISLFYWPARRAAPICKWLLVLGCVACVSIPIVKLPNPTGSYGVGTHRYKFVDSARIDDLSGKNEPRRLAVQVWYPSEPNVAGKKAPYMASSNDATPFIAAPLPAVAASHLQFIKTNAVSDAPLSLTTEHWPVVIFSHGLMGGSMQNTVQCEELSSHGYVVAAIDHTYDSSFAVFPRGDVITSNLLAGTRDEIERVRHRGLAVRTADVSFVLNKLTEMNKRSFANRLDLDRVGVFGHSFGGTTSLNVCSRDPRFKCGIAYDASAPREINTNCPFQFLQAAKAGDPRGNEAYCKSHPNSRCLSLPNTGHANFTDLPLLTPLHFLVGLSGSASQSDIEAIINHKTLAFFHEHLSPDRKSQ